MLSIEVQHLQQRLYLIYCSILLSQVKIWFQNRRMKWRNSKERELLAAGGSRDQTLPTKHNPNPDLSDVDPVMMIPSSVSGMTRDHVSSNHGVGKMSTGNGMGNVSVSERVATPTDIRVDDSGGGYTPELTVDSPISTPPMSPTGPLVVDHCGNDGRGREGSEGSFPSEPEEEEEVEEEEEEEIKVL